MSELYRKNRTFFNVEDDTWTALALWAILSYNGLLESFNKITAYFLNKKTIWDTAIIAPILIICIILGTLSAIKKLQRREFILVTIIALLWILSFFINEHSRQVMQIYYFKPVIFDGFCGIICISSFTNWKRFRTVGKWFILTGVTVFIISMFLCVIGEIEIGYMATSYNSLIFVIGAFWLAIHKKNVFYWILAVLGLFMITVAGCRGGIVCIAVYVLAEFLFNKKIHIVAKVLFFLIIALMVFNIDNIMLLIDGELDKLGFESRTVEMFLEGNIQDDSGRSKYRKAAWEVAKEHPVLGCGFGCSSYYLFEKINGLTPVGLQRVYSHNLFFDILMDFGVVFGTILSFVLIFAFVLTFKKSRKNKNVEIYFLLFSLIIPKLMMSSIYISESSFFILLGLMLNFNFIKYDDNLVITEVEG